MKARKNVILLGTLVLALTLTKGAGQITTRLGDKEVTAKILGYEELTLFKDAADTNGQKRLALLAVGSVACAHPDFQDLQGGSNPRMYHHVKTQTHATTVEATPLASTNHAILVTGTLLLVLDVGPNGEPRSFHDWSLFLPGSLWNVKEEIPYGFENKTKGKLRRLNPGSYSIGPYGEPEIQTSSSKQPSATNRARVDGAANGSQPIRPETNGTSSAAGSRR